MSRMMSLARSFSPPRRSKSPFMKSSPLAFRHLEGIFVYAIVPSYRRGFSLGRVLGWPAIPNGEGSMLSKFKQRLFPSPEELGLRKQELRRRIAERENKSQPEVVIRVSSPSERPAPLPPITLSSPACPYCRIIQEPPPARRRKCRDCGETIHVRIDREERKKYLLTAEEAERRAEKDARQARERRNEEWRRLSQQVQVAMQAGDLQSLQSAYQQQANILFVEGRPHLHVAQEAKRAELMSLLEIGVAEVEIGTCDDERVCAHCRSLDGKVFAIQEALEAMPIPGPSCTDGNKQSPHGGRCRCVYSAIFPGLGASP